MKRQRLANWRNLKDLANGDKTREQAKGYFRTLSLSPPNKQRAEGVVPSEQSACYDVIVSSAAALGIGPALLVLIGTAFEQTELSREQFLQKVDAALQSRDANALASLADNARWRTTGYPPLAQLKLLLPDGPIARAADASPTDVIYKDGLGRSWRLQIRESGEGSWRISPKTTSCPGPPVLLGPPMGRGAIRTPEVQSWTPLQCWPPPS
jgi:hypothetical protein